MKELFTIMLVALFVMTLWALARGEWNNAGIAGTGFILLAVVLIAWEGVACLVRRLRGEER